MNLIKKFKRMLHKRKLQTVPLDDSSLGETGRKLFDELDASYQTIRHLLTDKRLANSNYRPLVEAKDLFYDRVKNILRYNELRMIIEDHK